MTDLHQRTGRNRRSGSPLAQALEAVLILGLGLGLFSIAATLVDRPALGWLGSTDPTVDAELAFPVEFGDRLATIETDAGVTVDRASGQPPVEIGEPVVARFTFTEPTADQRVIWVVWRSLGSVLVVGGLWLTLSIVRSTKVGDPFVRANVKRLWRLAALVSIGGVAHSMVSGSAATLMIQRSAAADLAPIQFTIEFLPLLLGLVVAVLAGVWQIGVEMRDDVAGMV